MPHRAGYFVLAYCWDHHCQELVQSLEEKLRHVERELGELTAASAASLFDLLNYYKKWHYNNDLYHAVDAEIERREFVIRSHGYRGYGVNRDLTGALQTLSSRYNHLGQKLEEAFTRNVEAVKTTIYLPRELVDLRRSDYIITELCNKLSIVEGGQVPWAVHPVRLDLDRYFSVMRHETREEVNRAILQKLFFTPGCSSTTVMKGTTGLHNRRSVQDLKSLANRNLREAAKELFDNLPRFTELNIPLLQRLHYVLSRDLDPSAGSFRNVDFPDRNGVTFDYGNFGREMKEFEGVVEKAARSFHDLPAFVWHLSEVYYMLIGIHPFWDANGRVARCLFNFMLLKKGIPPLSFEGGDELFALPRYGGTTDDMHDYLRRSISRAVEAYFYERDRICTHGLYDRPIRNVSFDSGVHFRQIGEEGERIEVQLKAIVGDTRIPSISRLADQCPMVFPAERLLRTLTIYAGFSYKTGEEWRARAEIKGGYSIREVATELRGARVFDVDFIVDVPPAQPPFRCFACSFVSREGDLIFNNKGLNYCHRMRGL